MKLKISEQQLQEKLSEPLFTLTITSHISGITHNIAPAGLKAFVWRLQVVLALQLRAGSPPFCLSCTLPIWITKGIAWRCADILRTFSVTSHQH